MIPIFPEKISKKGIALYGIALASVVILFFRYTMTWYYYLIGMAFILLFFLGATSLTQKWHRLPEDIFVKKIFITALVLRVAWVLFSYFFYKTATGIPFEFDTADALGYHDTAKWLHIYSWDFIFEYLYGSYGISDIGYHIYLIAIYKIFGDYVIPIRLFKALWGALTCLLLYKLSRRNIGEKPARMAAIFACLMPNLIIYCGLHTKETEMVFLIVAFLERADYLIRSRRYNIMNILVPLLLGSSLFFFRTVLGVVALFSLLTALVFTQKRIIGKAKRALLIAWSIVAIAYMAGGTLMNEVEGYWEMRDSNEQLKRNYQASKGVAWAKYATGTVMAPMIFVLPFPTMADVDGQYNQNMMHSGNFIRNFLGIFVILAIYISIFQKKNWRNLSLIGSFAAGYLGVISISGYANSERFLLPALPLLLIMAAYGLSNIDVKNYKIVKLWYWVVPLMSIAWAYFKIGARGLL